MDFDGDTRNVTTPDIGADEFNGTGLDLTAPNIVYTPLANTASNSEPHTYKHDYRLDRSADQWHRPAR
jgi:hypothetical protein